MENIRTHPDFERIRSGIHKMQRPEYLASEIPDIATREDIRSLCFSGIPLADRFDFSDDKQFAGSFLVARLHFNTLPDYDERLSYLAEVILQRCSLTLGKGIQREDGPHNEAVETPVIPQDPVGSRISSALPGVVTTVEIASDQALQEEQDASDAFIMRLFADRPIADSDTPLSLLGVRPGSDIASMMKWISGETLKDFPYLPVIHIPSQMMDLDLPTLEIDLRSDLESFLGSMRVRPELEPRVLSELGEWFRDQSSEADLVFSNTVAMRTRDAFEAVIETFHPDQPRQLRGVNAELMLSDDLKSCFALACDLEDHFLADIDPETEPDLDQLIIGSISEKCRISQGLLLQRAVSCHLITGYPMDTALCMSALEMRFAQALRIVGWDAEPDPLADFDQRFLEDCRQPLSSYTLCENLVMEI